MQLYPWCEKTPLLMLIIITAILHQIGFKPRYGLQVGLTSHLNVNKLLCLESVTLAVLWIT